MNAPADIVQSLREYQWFEAAYEKEIIALNTAE